MKNFVRPLGFVLATLFASAARAEGNLKTAGNLLVALTAEYGGLYSLINAICYTAGTALFVYGVVKLHGAAKQQHGRQTVTQVIMGLFGSILILYAPTVINATSCTLGLNTMNQVFDYQQTTGGSGAYAEYMRALIDFIRFVGLCAMVSGVFSLRSIAAGTNAQEVTLTSVKWKMVGGAMAWNIVSVAGLVTNTFHLANGFVGQQVSSYVAAGSSCAGF